jgi:predicted DNA-binding transcriptional regulator YafY
LKRFTVGRIYRIHEKIRNQSFPNISSLTKDEEVCRRTIERDIQLLKYSLNAPIKYSKENNGYYYEKDFNFPFPLMTAGEVLSLFVATHLLKEFKNTPLADDIEKLQVKLEQLFPENIFIKPEDLEAMLSVSLQPIHLKKNIKETFQIIFKALKERKRILINYHSLSSDEHNERKVDPYHIFNFEGVWYLVGYCNLRQSLRDFALDRIESIKLLNENYSIPDDFNPKEYLNKAFRIYRGNEEEIEIFFDSYQARWIKERIWHRSQEIKENIDGSIMFKVKGNREEIKRWLIGFGCHAKVISPSPFRKEIEDEIKNLKEIYRENL